MTDKTNFKPEIEKLLFDVSTQSKDMSSNEPKIENVDTNTNKNKNTLSSKIEVFDSILIKLKDANSKLQEIKNKVLNDGTSIRLIKKEPQKTNISGIVVNLGENLNTLELEIDVYLNLLKDFDKII